MATDVLSLAGIVFTDFSPPREMMSGGNQAMVVHKLPGGSRVIDTLGPDEADIRWDGFFFGDNAYANVLALDAIRAAGQVVPLTWGGQFRSVIVNNFIYRVRRMPNWCFYDISCTVAQNPGLGVLGASVGGLDSMIIGDLALAVGL
jgi:hypothetical protein